MAPSHRRQAHDKARPKHRRRAIRAGCAGPIFDPDGAAMGFDDLLGDGEAEAGILTKALMRAIGIEAFENLFERVGAHAWPVVIDENLDLAAQPPASHAHRAAR